MNKELREDLEHLIICKDKTITQDLRDDIKMTLDYIDELEKENEVLKKPIVENWENARTIKINNPLQQRIDKAIDKLDGSWVDNCGELTDKDCNSYELKEVIDILRGEE